MSKARDLADFISTGSILSDGTIESTEISGVTADATEINKLDGLTADTTELNTLDGVTATTAELNKLAGTTATTSDFDKLSNVTASATELNYMTGATSSIQSQLDNISVTSGSLTKSFTNGETASITLSSALSTAPVVGVTKEVAQTGISSKGAWDVNATASNYELHNTAYDTTLTPSSIGSPSNDIGTASYASKSYQTQSGTSTDLFIGNNGTKLYNLISGVIHQHTLSTAYDISTASSDSASFTLISQNGQSNSFFFKDDGTKLYVTGLTNGKIYQYNLSTAWDITSASYSNVDYTLPSSYPNQPVSGLVFKPDGTKFYCGTSQTDLIYEFNLSTAWDLSTASYNSVSISAHSSDVNNLGMAFSNDGLNMFVVWWDFDTVNQYSLSTAWDLSTASYTGNSLSFASEDTNAQGIFLSPDNLDLYVMGTATDYVYQYSMPSTSALTLGTGSFASTDVGKRIQGNGGDVTLTSAAGAYDTTGGSDFTDSSTIASGSWTMRGLKSVGDADGIGMSGLLGAGGDLNNSVYTGSSLDPSAPDVSGIYISEAGTKLFVLDAVNSDILEWTIGTAHDITTATNTNDRIAAGGSENDYRGMTFKPDGTRMFLAGSTQQRIYMYNFNTGFDISAGTSFFGSGTVNGSHEFPGGIALSPDGTKLFHTSGASDQVAEYSLGNPWDFETNVSFNGSYNVGVDISSPTDVDFNSDGTKMFVLDRTGSRVGIYSLTTPYQIWNASGVSYDGEVSIASNPSVPKSFSFSDSYDNMYIAGDDEVIYQYTTSEVIQPTSQYHIAVTNSGGQIDSSNWVDINSMTADQAAGGGTVHYAVSTDDRTTWSVAKASDGVRPIVRDNSGTWQYNSDNVSTSTLDITGATYSGDANTFSTSSQDTQSYTVSVKPDGTKIYVASYNSDAVYQYDLSTAFDLSTASYNSVSFNFSAQMSTPRDIQFKPDGTEMYLNDRSTDTIYQYTMSTAWDLSTASYSGYSFNTSITNNTYGIFFKPDGTKLYISDGGSTDQLIYEHTLTTPWRVDTASYDSKYLNARTQMSNVLTSFAINPTGTKVHAYDYGSRYLYEYDLSTAWDMSTASYNSVNVHLDPQPSANGYGSPTTIHLDYTSGYLYAMRSERLFEWSGFTTSTLSYSTTATWADATTNDEFYALQQALSLANNRMDKTQLDAVADGSHFTLGDTLDLAIALRQDTASASTPKSDGVSINYDAAALNQGAVLGTDYDYDFPDSTTVRVTSNAAQNLKIRVV